MYQKSKASKFIVFVTGATPNEVTASIDEVWKNNLTTDELVSDLPLLYAKWNLL